MSAREFLSTHTLILASLILQYLLQMIQTLHPSNHPHHHISFEAINLFQSKDSEPRSYEPVGSRLVVLRVHQVCERVKNLGESFPQKNLHQPPMHYFY